MTNDEIKAAIQAKWNTIEAAATSLKIARETLTKALNSEKPLKEKYRVKLRALGLSIPKIVTKSDDSIRRSKDEKTEVWYERAIKYLQEAFEATIESKDDNLADVKENLADIRENNKGMLQSHAELTASHKTYRRMVEMCLDLGIIIPNKEKAIVQK